jgi:hypothetical protein
MSKVIHIVPSFQRINRSKAYQNLFPGVGFIFRTVLNNQSITNVFLF